jgi:uncharacterized pyridoxamine 5'-phosphate oxidase family protein
MKRVLEFLAKNAPFYLATLKGGEPAVRPMGLAFGFHGRIYFGCGAQKQVRRQIVDNPRVQLAATAPDGTWLRYSGLGVFDDDPDIYDAAVQAFPPLAKAYPKGSESNISFFFLKHGKALFCDGSGAVLETLELSGAPPSPRPMPGRAHGPARASPPTPAHPSPRDRGPSWPPTARGPRPFRRAPGPSAPRWSKSRGRYGAPEARGPSAGPRARPLFGGPSPAALSGARGPRPFRRAPAHRRAGGGPPGPGAGAGRRQGGTPDPLGRGLRGRVWRGSGLRGSGRGRRAGR